MATDRFPLNRWLQASRTPFLLREKQRTRCVSVRRRQQRQKQQKESVRQHHFSLASPLIICLLQETQRDCLTVRGRERIFYVFNGRKLPTSLDDKERVKERLEIENLLRLLT